MNEKAIETASHTGIPIVTDGSGAAVWVEKHGSQGAFAYPITPSTNMGVEYAAAVADGFRNLWDEPLVFLEPESEHSSASAAEGFASAGGRVTNFTSGQGLVLMKEVLFTISGKRLPAVFHVGSRALTSQSLNVHAGHDDVMAVADTGWGILFASNAQEVADLALISRRAAENSHTPFFCCQDGFLTTHTLETVRLPEPVFMKEYLGRPEGARPLPDGSPSPRHVRSGPEPGLLHEGEGGAAVLHRPRARIRSRGDEDLRRGDRPASESRSRATGWRTRRSRS